MSYFAKQNRYASNPYKANVDGGKVKLAKSLGIEEEIFSEDGLKVFNAIFDELDNDFKSMMKKAIEEKTESIIDKNKDVLTNSIEALQQLNKKATEEAIKTSKEIANLRNKLEETDKFAKEMDVIDFQNKKLKEALFFYEKILQVGERHNVNADESSKEAGYILYAYFTAEHNEKTK